jgi:hypothetical protein
MGDFWYGRPATDTLPLVARGAVSLVVFVPQVVNEEELAMNFVELRRLQAQFPALRIIVVTATTKQFGNEILLTVRAAADSIHHYFTDVYRVPGMLSVSARSMFALPKPDNRVLLLQTANEHSYGFSKTFLVDSQGRIVIAMKKLPEANLISHERISALIQRLLGRVDR